MENFKNQIEDIKRTHEILKISDPVGYYSFLGILILGPSFIASLGAMLGPILAGIFFAFSMVLYGCLIFLGVVLKKTEGAWRFIETLWDNDCRKIIFYGGIYGLLLGVLTKLFGGSNAFFILFAVILLMSINHFAPKISDKTSLLIKKLPLSSLSNTMIPFLTIAVLFHLLAFSMGYFELGLFYSLFMCISQFSLAIMSIKTLDLMMSVEEI